jgi:glycosyltransferase involved in cell wall biosynthesis
VSPEPATHYPRVLVVAASALAPASGTGVTLANLFHGFPPDMVAQIHLDAGTPDTALCGHSLRLPNNGSPVEGPLRSVATMLSSRPQPSTAITAARPPADGTHWAKARAWVSAGFDLMPGHLSRATLEWARDFNPDVIYSPLGSIRMLSLVRALADRLAIPIAPHLMDAWPHTLFSDGEVFGLAHRQVRHSLARVAERSPRLLAISRPMADEFSRELGIPSSVFMNCVSEEDFAQASPTCPSNDQLLFSYVGGLHLDRWRSLLQLAEVLHQEAGGARLQVHAPEAHLDDHRAAFANANNVDWGPSLSADQVPAALRRADVLVHVESFAPAAQRFTRLSISTKIPQYMAARRPILAIGPESLASMRHIEDAGAGLVVRTQDRDTLVASVSTLAGDSLLRATLANRGRAYAERHHSQASVSKAFASCLSEVARDGRVDNARIWG